MVPAITARTFLGLVLIDLLICVSGLGLGMGVRVSRWLLAVGCGLGWQAFRLAHDAEFAAQRFEVDVGGDWRVVPGVEDVVPSVVIEALGILSETPHGLVLLCQRPIDSGHQSTLTDVFHDLS